MYYFINGIRSSIPGTTGSLSHVVSDMGLQTRHLYRPTTRTWNSRSKTYLTYTANQLIAQTRPGNTVIAHSQGCLQTYHMMLEWQKDNLFPLFDNIVMIAPAMNRTGWKWDELNFDKMLVIYNPADLAIWAGSVLWFHPFGLAGVRGFVTDDPRITQQADDSKVLDFLKHNHYFKDYNLRNTANTVVNFCQND